MGDFEAEIVEGRHGVAAEGQVLRGGRLVSVMQREGGYVLQVQITEE